MSTPALEAPAGLSLVEVPVDRLTAHPGNVRRDMQIRQDLIDSVKRFGVLVPLIVTEDGDELRVTDGHRRLLAAVEAKRASVPCVLNPGLSGQEAQQYLEMVVTSRHREGLTALEEATALFAAHQLGAPRTAVAAALGSRAAGSQALKAGALPEAQKDAVAECDYTFTLDQLADLSDYQDRPEVFDRLLTAAAKDDFDRQLQLVRIDDRDEAEREIEENRLKETGITVLRTLPGEARRVHTLAGPTGKPMTDDEHRACPGHCATVTAGSPPTVTYYCADPAENGHSALTVARAAAEQDAASRTLVTAGNREWRAAEELRHKFLTAYIGQASVDANTAEAINRLTASVWLSFPEPLHNGAQAKVREIQAQLLGQKSADDQAMGKVAYQTDRRRLPLVMLATIAAPFEAYACFRKVWRTDLDPYEMRWRPFAAHWLGALAGLGHKLTPIEQAVVEGAEYHPEAKQPRGAQPDAEPDSEEKPDTATSKAARQQAA
jgi:ParB family chromosome partitioning protein